MSNDVLESVPDDSRIESDQTHLRIHPSSTELDPSLIGRTFQRLHRLGTDDSDSLLDRLPTFGSNPSSPTFEVLLVGDGTGDVQYYLGIDDPTLLDAFQHHLRRLFPTGYTLEAVSEPLSEVLALHDPDDAVDAGRLAAIEYRGAPDRYRDWQLPLTDVTDLQEATGSDAVFPLSAIVESMASAPVPLVYQALVRPKPDWTDDLDAYLDDLQNGDSTPVGWLYEELFGTEEPTDSYSHHQSHDHRRSPSTQARMDALQNVTASRTFDVNARAVAVDHDPNDHDARTAIREFDGVFGDLGTDDYDLITDQVTGQAAKEVVDAITDRTVTTATHRWVRGAPLLDNTSTGIVADAHSAPAFCLLDGDALATAGARGVDRTPDEKTPVPRPPDDTLDTYRTDGFTIGRPLTQDGTPDDDPIAVPPSLQPMHVALFGQTGAGKTTTSIRGFADNHAATDGLDVLIDSKGDGMPVEYLRTHYAQFGHLDDVIYFDCANLLPAFSFFDIRDELDAGIDRTTAVEDTVDHYVEILTQLMGEDRFRQAVRAPDIIRYLVKALFDPVSGDDAFSHRDLLTAARTMQERQSPPTVSDDDLDRMLSGFVANRKRTFDEIMAGVANRLEKIPVDRRLARIFNHVDDPDDPDVPHFDLADYLNEDVVVIFDMGALRSQAQRALTMVVLSNLWTALRRRDRATDGDRPLVNLHVEEAASVADTELMQDLLAQARGFDCSVTLSMQFPAQLRDTDTRVYEEVLNNVSTFITGSVPVDDKLTRRLATDDMPPEDVGNRLRSLRRGEWLVSLPAPFAESPPRPFAVESMPLPPGHPEGEDPLFGRAADTFDESLEAVHDRTADSLGLELEAPSVVDDSENADRKRDADSSTAGPERGRVDTALPYTRRLPEVIAYDADGHRLHCTECQSHYDPTMGGLERAISCCGSLDDVDRDDVPICELNLKLTPEERAATDYSDRQLMFLQAAYNAQQLRYQSRGYDLLQDSMVRLMEYVDVDTGAVQSLVDDGLLRLDTKYPHHLYTVTSSGRDLIGESYRLGVEYGHGKGDLAESSHHVMAVEAARQYLEQEYAENPDSAVTDVVPYYESGDDRRLDLAGIDADDDVIIALEAERVNHDTAEAVPADFDKMAACEPEEAIWVVPNRDSACAVMEALNDPADGEPRIDKVYSKNSPPRRYSYDTAGLTEVLTLGTLCQRIGVR